MSYRRSTRLASRNLTPVTTPNIHTNSGSDLIYEENDAQHFSLRTQIRTPRIGLRKLRSNSGASANSPEAEAGRTVDESPTVFTQNRFQNKEAKINANDGPGFDSKFDSSIGNDSLLFAVEQLELEGEYGESKAVGSTDNKEIQPLIPKVSEDAFGDDEDAFPATPPNELASVTPTRSTRRKRSRTPRRLELDKFSYSNPQNEENAQRFVSAVDEIEATKEPEPKRSKKRSNVVVKENKKSGHPAKKQNKKKKGKFQLAFTNRKAIRELANSASNELSKDDLSMMSHEEKLLLSSWGLPQSILNQYNKKKITSLFPWQLQCLENERVLEGRNLLYSAPTSAGKTLVSEILMIKRVLELGRKAIMILPFVSVAREKVFSLQSTFGEAGVRVEGFMGSVNPPGGFKAVDIAVCTIEKANSLVNKLLEEECLADLGTLVVDELHLLGDPHRGYLLELLLTKILYMTSIKNQCTDSTMDLSNNTMRYNYNIQIIGMSATLPNLDVLAKWLNAELYVTDFRPIPLKEHLKVENELLDESLCCVRPVKIDSLPIEIPEDADHIIYLTLETVLNGFSVLIFCPTKANVETTAKRIAFQFYNIGCGNIQNPEIMLKLRATLNTDRIKGITEQLKACSGGADEELKRTIMFGVGFHHAGLTYENRDIVENAFKAGTLRVIVATSTLSAGVNLPARRVIISTPMFNRSVLDPMVYRQMCGRAGRNGIDTEGESILICPADQKDNGVKLYRGVMPIVRSALLSEDSLTSAMKRALLEAIASGIATVVSDVLSYAKCTFLFYTLDRELYPSEELTSSQLNKDSTVEECLKYLESQDFIRLKHFEQKDKPKEYKSTQLGSACLASSLPPDDGVIVYKELLRAMEKFSLSNELHIIYQVTPIYVSAQMRNIDWHDYWRIWESLDLSEKKVADLVGVTESFILKAMMGAASWSNPSQVEKMKIHQRFYAALALSDLVNEKPLDQVARKFNLNKGLLQNLQTTASTFAGMVTAFCDRLGWKNLELLLSQFQERLEFGVQRELCDLVRLDCLNGQRARILYDAGFKTVVELAAADAADIEQVLHKASPFKSDVHGGRESSIWLIGKEYLTESEAALKIVTLARKFVQKNLDRILEVNELKRFNIRM